MAFPGGVLVCYRGGASRQSVFRRKQQFPSGPLLRYRCVTDLRRIAAKEEKRE
jgi:hypothetical protein